MAITYDIEQQDGTRWHGDIGESRGWASVDAAETAIESLRSLGDEWLGTYRILESESRRVVRHVTLAAHQREPPKDHE